MPDPAPTHINLSLIDDMLSTYLDVRKRAEEENDIDVIAACVVVINRLLDARAAVAAVGEALLPDRFGVPKRAWHDCLSALDGALAFRALSGRLERHEVAVCKVLISCGTKGDSIDRRGALLYLVEKVRDLPEDRKQPVQRIINALTATEEGKCVTDL